MKSHTDGIDKDLIDPSEPFIDWMITELSGTDGEKSTDSAQHTRLFSEFIIN